MFDGGEWGGGRGVEGESNCMYCASGGRAKGDGARWGACFPAVGEEAGEGGEGGLPGEVCGGWGVLACCSPQSFDHKLRILFET